MSSAAEAIVGLSIALAVGLALLAQRSVHAAHLARVSTQDALLVAATKLFGTARDATALLESYCTTLVDGLPPLTGAALVDPSAALDAATLACAPSDNLPSAGEFALAGRAAAVHHSVTTPLPGNRWSHGMVLAVPLTASGDRVLLVQARAPLSEADRRLIERLTGDLALALDLLAERFVNERLAQALASVGDGVVTTDPAGRVDWVNPAFAATWAEPTEVVGLPLIDVLRRLGAVLDDTVTTDSSLRADLVTRDGARASARISYRMLGAPSEGHTGSVVAILHDLRPEQAAEDIRTQLTHILEETSDGVAIVDRYGRILFVNAGTRRLLAIPPEEPVEDRVFLELLSSEADRALLAAIHEDAVHLGVVRTEVEITLPDGTTMPLSLVLLAHREANGRVRYLSAIARDIRDQRAREEQLSYLAQHDPLTNLPNRRLFEPFVQAGIERAERQGLALALGVIDLDDFKPVNDSLGHPAGDRLLTELARRLASMTRESDHLLRLGGDEFALLLTDIDPADPTSEIRSVLARIHRAIEAPFEVAPGLSVSIDMTMGISLYPRDGGTPDALLREADAALYAAKKARATRQRWWRLANEPTPPPTERRPGPYGSSAAAKLARLSERDELVTRVAQQFYDELLVHPLGMHLAWLSEEEREGLSARFASHVAFLLDPALNHDALLSAARSVGRIHALSGLAAQDLVEGAHLLEGLLTRAIAEAPGSPRDRRAISEVAERRLKDEATAELEGMEQLRRQYLAVLTRSSPPPETPWSDVIADELEALGALPGTRSVCLARPDRSGSFVIEVNAGPLGERVAQILNQPESQINTHPEHPRGKGHGAVAWREAQIHTAAALHLDPNHTPWHSAIIEGRIRSLLAIPIQNFIGQPIALVLVYGQYPGQYESEWMAQFARNLQQRFESLFARYQAPPLVTSRETALAYRKLLLTGGLRMYVQPIVDLGSGELRMVEGLARLADGAALIQPGAFLGILGLNELDQLFRLGLEELTTHYRDWATQGITPALSLNVPSSTLVHPEVVDWVAATLAANDIPPSQLVLEILESDPEHLSVRSGALARLLELGVRLAIDDMGSGYSNWLRVVDLPASFIKVDHTFVQRVLYMPHKAIALLGTLMLAATEAHQILVVEGLEDPSLVDMATHIGATLGQGFAIARPMPAGSLPEWVHGYRPQAGTEIRTLLGAMAYHWSFAHSPNRDRRGPADSCPLSRFFVAHGLAGSKGAQLHADLHDGAGPETIEALTNWFEQALTKGIAPPLAAAGPRTRGHRR